MTSLVSKLRWRLAFLVRPRGYLERHWDAPCHGALRDLLIEQAESMSLRRRLRMLGPGSRVSSLDAWLEGCRREDEAGRPWLDLGRIRLYYLPSRRTVDDDEALRGAVHVVNEAFVAGPGFFSDDTYPGKGDVVLDLGANLGTSAILLSDLVGVGGRVYSFEPVFNDLLERNVRANGLGNVEVVPVAVGPRVGEVRFRVTDFGLDSRQQRDGHDTRGRIVPMTTVDAFVDERGIDRVDFIKLDVEGGEEGALRGATETISRHRPRLAVASYHTDPSGERQHPKLLALLDTWDYRTSESGDGHIHAAPSESASGGGAAADRGEPA